MAKRNTNKAKATRTGNRLGKIEMEMDATCGNQACKPRRSIPVEEVNSIIEKAVREVKSQRTIYDDRLAVLDRLGHNEQQINEYEELLHRTRLRNKELRLELARVNLAITRQMELDGE
jgi:hypothetical protein